MRQKQTFFYHNLSNLSELLVAEPNEFIRQISKNPDWLGEEAAHRYDQLDPLNDTAKLFNIGPIIPFAGHSLGPVFIPVNERIAAINELQKQGLHSGHFPGTEPVGNWFDCDVDPQSIVAAKSILGFAEEEEFVFSANGLSSNLAMLMEAFYRTTSQDWKTDKTKIVY